MPRRSSAPPRSGCPISVALELVGDPWSLLIVRDLMFKGMHTFNEFLQAGEGIATNILSDRLSRLEDASIISRMRDASDGRRHIYQLTAKGVDLAPMMVELAVWSARHQSTDAPPDTIKAMTEQREEFVMQLRDAWRASASSLEP